MSKSELLHHAHLIPLLAAFDNLPASNAVKNHPVDAHTTPCRGSLE
jgi:hypothetical protein